MKSSNKYADWGNFEGFRVFKDVARFIKCTTVIKSNKYVEDIYIDKLDI